MIRPVRVSSGLLQLAFPLRQNIRLYKVMRKHEALRDEQKVVLSHERSRYWILLQPTPTAQCARNTRLTSRFVD